ncbi:MAG: enterochelin esterase domain-containing protein [Microbacterium gubbeenense]|uniref:enterochelin esterase domain-containing protein n=4 Tax=Microbacterium gubbeenense TaxID=159896 RepID=UPI00040095E7|nr:enterochelin esterase domain-containing protein [Microbacterium gubbeenense]
MIDAAFAARPDSADRRALTTPPHTPRRVGVERGSSPAVEAVRDDPSSAEEFWERIVRDGTPLVEGTGSVREYTWAHRGEAERVALVAGKLTDDTTMDDVMFERLPGTDLFALTLRIRSDWRGTYALAVDDGSPAEPSPALAERRARALGVTDPARHDRVTAWYELVIRSRPDPLAREQFRGASVASGPDAPPLPERASSDEACHIFPARIPSASGGVREAVWYLPHGIARAGGVIVMLDGDRRLADGEAEFAAWARAHLAADTAVLLLGHGSLAERDADLTCNPALVDDLRALLADAPIEIPAHPERTAIQGSSLGGLSALYAQCVAPEVFGTSICQSPSFWWPNAKSGHDPEWLTTALASSAARLRNVHLSVGSDEWVLLDPVRRMRDVVRTRADRLDYEEFAGGHDVPCWEASLPRVLRAFGV